MLSVFAAGVSGFAGFVVVKKLLILFDCLIVMCFVMCFVMCVIPASNLCFYSLPTILFFKL